jgi:hypothetical protein
MGKRKMKPTLPAKRADLTFIFAFAILLVVGLVYLNSGGITNPPVLVTETHQEPTAEGPRSTQTVALTSNTATAAAEPPTATNTPVPTETPVPTATPTETAVPGSEINPLPLPDTITGGITIEQAFSDIGGVVLSVDGTWYRANGLQVVAPVAYYGITGQHWLKADEASYPVLGTLSQSGGYLTLWLPYELTPDDIRVNALWETERAEVAASPVNIWDTSPFGQCLTMIAAWRNIGWNVANVSYWAGICYGPDEAQGLPVSTASDTTVPVESMLVGNNTVEIWITHPYLQASLSYSMMLKDGIQFPDLVIGPNMGLRNVSVGGQMAGELFLLDTGKTFAFSVYSSQVYLLVRADGIDNRVTMVFKLPAE